MGLNILYSAHTNVIIILGLIEFSLISKPPLQKLRFGQLSNPSETCQRLNEVQTLSLGHDN